MLRNWEVGKAGMTSDKQLMPEKVGEITEPDGCHAFEYGNAG
jgi:hypothetical protein